jgi:hypothetical protein
MKRQRSNRRAPKTPTVTAESKVVAPGDPRPPAERWDSRTKALAWSLLAAVFFLVIGVDERTLGFISDEKQLTFTSVALAEFGEIGIARGQPFAVHRPEGDAIAPYGIGAPLVFSLASRVAYHVDAKLGVGASQSIYALLQTLLVAATALCVGLLVRFWSGTPQGIAVGVFGTAVASPLWPYASTLYSEPLQALTLIGALTLSAAAVRALEARRAILFSVAAGAVAGIAVLTKSQALLAVPFVLLPILVDRCSGPRLPRLGGAAAGLAPVLAGWLWLEIHRFGRPFASYGGVGFTHPVLDGLWRLTVGPNKGLLLYFPLSVLAVAGLWRLCRDGNARGSGFGITGVALSVLILISAWWAWDGTVGWGPRLLVPIVPLLGAAAGFAVSGAVSRRLAWGLVAAGVALNSLGVLQTDSSFQRYLRWAEPVTISESRAATLPSGFLSTGPDGKPRVAALHEVSMRADLSPFRVHAWLLSLRLTKRSEQIDSALISPPWDDLKPRNAEAFLAEAVPELRAPFRWQHLFSALFADRATRERAYYPAWVYAITDQIARATDTGRLDRVLDLSERLYYRVSPSPYPAALYAEALRLSGRRETLDAFLGSLPRPFFSSPRLGVVMALDARDREDETRARKVLRAVFAHYPRPAIGRALESPMSAWPRDLNRMWGDSKAYAVVVLPGAEEPSLERP